MRKATPKTRLPEQPYRVLPTALLKDDFYINLLDWADSGHIAVGLQSTLYLWSGYASTVTKVQEFRSESESLCGVNFLPGGNRLALGLSRGDMSIFDLERQKS